MIIKKILWTIKRHPFLYRSRFKLLSRNSSVKEIETCSYNEWNSISEIPSYFNEINKHIFPSGQPQSDLDKVKVLSQWLVQNIKGGQGLSEPSEDALKLMLSGEGGVCSDMAQIFNNFCVINDIKVREWGSTRAPFEKEYGGHSYNEVYINELDKWVLVDVSYCLMFFNGDSPLSVIELYQLLRDEMPFVYRTFVTSQVFNEESVYRNYLNPNTVPFLICNYSNTTYDSYLKLFRPRVPVFMIHFLLYVLKKSYHYRFPLNDYKQIF
jgi:hypothetical protein